MYDRMYFLEKKFCSQEQNLQDLYTNTEQILPHRRKSVSCDY